MRYFEQHREAVSGRSSRPCCGFPASARCPNTSPTCGAPRTSSAGELRAAGLHERRTDRRPRAHPLVYGEWLGAPGKPTLLLYGHYDVQPPDPLEEWKSPPFEPDIRDDNIYARGACDDKGQTYILVKAVEGLLKTRRQAPGQREVPDRGRRGGRRRTHRGTTSRRTPARLKADAAVVCDTEMFAPDLPTHLHGPARHRLRRTARAGRRPRPALGRLRRRGAEPDHGDRRDPHAR